MYSPSRPLLYGRQEISVNNWCFAAVVSKLGANPDTGFLVHLERCHNLYLEAYTALLIESINKI